MHTVIHTMQSAERFASQALDMFSRVVANCSAVIGIDPRPAFVRAIGSRIKDGMTE